MYLFCAKVIYTFGGCRCEAQTVSSWSFEKSYLQTSSKEPIDIGLSDTEMAILLVEVS